MHTHMYFGHSHHFIIFNFVLSFMLCVWVLYLHVCLCHVYYLVPTEARSGRRICHVSTRDQVQVL